MTRLPRVTGREIVRALLKAGFSVNRTRDSHVFLKHPDGRGRIHCDPGPYGHHAC
jgi:predicted RNA binding protein YcfA (HicA-like mRNA interferase family)